MNNVFLNCASLSKVLLELKATGSAFTLKQNNVLIYNKVLNIVLSRALWPYSLTKSDFSDSGYFSGHVLSKMKSVTFQ